MPELTAPRLDSPAPSTGVVTPLAPPLVWSAPATPPAAVDAALRELLARYHERVRRHAPSRAANLVVVVDASRYREIEQQLDWAARLHTSRMLVCVVNPGQRTVGATARLLVDEQPRPDAWSFSHDHVVLTVGETHARHLETVVGPLLIRDLPTLLWAPRIGHDGFESLVGLAEAILLDTEADRDVERSLLRAASLPASVRVVDLAWLRSAPWRERIAAAFDPPTRRAELALLNGVGVRHHPRSRAAAMLFVGWLTTQLGWSVGRLVPAGGDGAMFGRAISPRLEIGLRLECEPKQAVPGLDAVTLETSAGTDLSLERAPGGLWA